jgi:uncharacterized membrane protein YfcA
VIMSFSDPLFWQIGGILFLAAAVHGLSGFGSALVAMPLLALYVDLRFSAPLVALSTVTINMLLLVPHRRKLSIGRVLPLLAGAAAGVPLGVIFLRTADETITRTALGVFLLLYGGASLWTRGAVPILSRGWGYVFGVFSGCLGGAFNTGGPPAVVYISSQRWEKEEVHAALQLYFMIVGLLVAASHAVAGLTTPAVLQGYVYSLPALLAGCAVGYGLHRRVGAETFRRIVFAMILLLGVLLLIG